jgi:hypothetical protein
LLDPYVTLSAEEQGVLLDYYRSLHPAGRDREHFERVYDLCAAQRLMQALGAYGFLGLQRDRADFLAHIPVALPRLLGVLRRIPALSAFAEWLTPLAANPVPGAPPSPSISPSTPPSVSASSASGLH